MKFIRAPILRAAIGAFLLLLALLYFNDPLNRVAAVMFLEDIAGANWRSGLCSKADLPVSASPEEILNKAYGSSSFQILETKKFWIPNNACWTVRCKHGGRIVTLFLYFQSGPNGLSPHNIIEWWTIKFYD